MKFQEIVEKRNRNATSENGLTSYEKDELIEAMFKKLAEMFYMPINPGAMIHPRTIREILDKE